MNRRERLMATLRGEPVDRPAVSFYDLNGLFPDPDDPDPFNVTNDPSWAPLYALTHERTDRIVSCHHAIRNAGPGPWTELTTTETWTDEEGSRFSTTTIRAGNRALTQRSKQTRDVMTVWTLEHLLKDVEDFEAWLALPEQEFKGTVDPTPVLDVEARLGDSGIALIDTADPLCCVAPLFEMGTYTIIAMTEPKLMHRALEKVARWLLPQVEAVARACPGRAWRIYGPEYASPPYLPPNLFDEYVVRYVTPMVDAIHRHGGFARIHSHGHLKDILDHIARTGAMGLDPIEPPPIQGDVELGYVRERHGRQFVLFGNIEQSDIEFLPADQFAVKVQRAVREGTAGEGRGFVLMPSASPYGRNITDLTLCNYETMVGCVEAMR